MRLHSPYGLTAVLLLTCIFLALAPKPGPSDSSLNTPRESAAPAAEWPGTGGDQTQATREFTNEEPTRPVVKPHAATGPLAGRTVALDAGHGGPDWGARGYSGSLEKENTLATTLRIKRVLEAAGARVILTRSGDYEPGLGKAGDYSRRRALLAYRPQSAAQAGADVFISVHNDSNPNPEMAGITAYYWKSPTLARAIQGRLATSLERPNLGVLQNDYYVLTDSPIPAVLLELGFISNPYEETLLSSPWYQERAATAIRDGLIQYFAHRS